MGLICPPRAAGSRRGHSPGRRGSPAKSEGWTPRRPSPIGGRSAGRSRSLWPHLSAGYRGQGGPSSGGRQGAGAFGVASRARNPASEADHKRATHPQGCVHRLLLFLRGRISRTDTRRPQGPLTLRENRGLKMRLDKGRGGPAGGGRGVRTASRTHSGPRTLGEHLKARLDRGPDGRSQARPAD